MTTPILYGGKHYPSRRALARELAEMTGRRVTALETLISACRGDAEAVHRRLFAAPAPPPAIPTTFNDQTFASRRALIRHLAQQLGQPFDTIQARYYALKGDAAAVVKQFSGTAASTEPSNTDDGIPLHLAPLFDLMLEIGTVLERLAGDVSRTAEERRRIAERLDLLLRSQTELRRVLGQTELHYPPRHTRRRPLGVA